MNNYDNLQIFTMIEDLKEKIRSLEDAIREIKQWQRNQEYKEMQQEQKKYK
jgi:hypothetical protein